MLNYRFYKLQNLFSLAICNNTPDTGYFEQKRTGINEQSI